MKVTRRTFLKSSSLLAGASLLPSWWRHPLVRSAMAQAANDRFLVVLYLEGGNDGLNTVVPLENGRSDRLREAYEAARHGAAGGLRIAAGELAHMLVAPDPQTQTGLALHPALTGIKNLYERGDVAILQGCGAPAYSLSHEVSRRVWQLGQLGSDGYASSGWLGRYLAARYASTDIAALSVRRDVAPELMQNATNVLAIPSLRDFSFPYDGWYLDDAPMRRAAFLSMQENALVQTQAALRSIGNTGAAALLTSERFPPLARDYANERPSFHDAYGAAGSEVARGLREIASVLYAVQRAVPQIDLRVFELQNHGYDTHSDQGSTGSGSLHARLLHEIGDGLEAFADDCIDMGVWDRVCVLVYSEFGRRVAQNANGTDHGSQAPLFVLGGQVNGGVYGNHPNINAAALDDNGNTPYSQAADDPFRTTDFRDVYGTIARHWLGVADPAVLLPPDVGDPRYAWTAADFSLPFLSGGGAGPPGTLV